MAVTYPEAAFAQCPNIKLINLDVVGNIGRVTGNATWLHKTSFLPNPAHNSPPLAPMTIGAIPVAVTPAAGFGPVTILEPAAGTYHTGAVACSRFFMGAIRPPTPTDPRSLIRGSVQWGEEPPTPSLLHGEYTGSTFAQSTLLARGSWGVATRAEYQITANGPDDGFTGGGNTLSAYDKDNLTFKLDGATLFQASTLASTTNGGSVSLFPVTTGLQLDATGLGTSALTWDYSGTRVGTASYFASLAGGVFSASSQWASAWQLTTVAGQVVSALLRPSLVPNFDWSSGEVTGTDFEIERDGEGEVTVAAVPTPEPSTLLLMSTGVIMVGSMRASRKRRRVARV
jgi:hypothetical protein